MTRLDRLLRNAMPLATKGASRGLQCHEKN